LSPVTDFGEACCRQYENNECTRGGFCNFMHIKVVSPAIKKDIFQAQTASIAILKPNEPAGMVTARPGDSYRDAGRAGGRY
jgi:splicing factor U2AF subunit